MGAPQHGQTRTAGRRSGAALHRRLFFAVVACSALSGCAGFWDDITSRDYHFKDAFKAKPEPLWVIRNSNDGDKKSKALRSLQEPLQHGGTKQDQEVIVSILVQSATSDPQVLCRMAAISALQHFKDPRAVEALKDAYYRASSFQREQPESTAVIKCQALAALGVNGTPAAVDLLVRVLKEPPQTGPEKDKQDSLNERIAAARALAHFPQYQAAEALVAVLRTDQDVALRNRVTESLQEMTGQELPADAQAWADFLHKSDKTDLAKKPSVGDKFLKLISFSSN